MKSVIESDSADSAMEMMSGFSMLANLSSHVIL